MSASDYRMLVWAVGFNFEVVMQSAGASSRTEVDYTNSSVQNLCCMLLPWSRPPLVQCDLHLTHFMSHFSSFNLRLTGSILIVLKSVHFDQ